LFLSLYQQVYTNASHRWSPGKNPTNTIHVDDVAGGAWACANWIAGLGRKAANEIAGVPILFHNDKSKVSEVEGMITHDKKPVVPLFNLVRSIHGIHSYSFQYRAHQVDDSNTTLVGTGKTVSSFFGTTFEFFNMIETTVFKVSIQKSLVDNIVLSIDYS
jgi:hypothetical protein